MCSQTICSSCRKPTWSGCGAHIDQALANVPWDARCKCRDPGRRPASAAATVPQPSEAPERRF